MAQKLEIPFNEVRSGEKFISLKTKRAFIGIKTQTVSDLVPHAISPNAVMLFYDHQQVLGPESGTLTYLEPETIVEVRRLDEIELKEIAGTQQLHIRLSDENREKIDWMMEVASLRQPKELVNNGLTLIYWAITAILEGDVVARVNQETKIYREILLPALENVACMRQNQTRQKK